MNLRTEFEQLARDSFHPSCSFMEYLCVDVLEPLLTSKERKKFKGRLYPGATEDDGDSEVYVKTSPFDRMVANFERTDLYEAGCLVDELSALLVKARPIKLSFEPIHVRLVGKAGQCKTQVALHVMQLFDECGLIGVSRSASDGYFDDVVKDVNKMVVEQRTDTSSGVYRYHPNTVNRSADYIGLDVMFLDEVGARKVNDPGMLIIMEGVTPMMWKVMAAEPKIKGKKYKPVLWISTSNHEITDHEYCIPAVQRRIHVRLIVSSGQLYNQTCYKTLDASGSFEGGFSTCQGTFGRWAEYSCTTSNTSSKDSSGNKSDSFNKSESNAKIVRIRDTHSLPSFICTHCEEVSFEKFLVQTLKAVNKRLKTSLAFHEASMLRIAKMRDQQKRMAAPVYKDSETQMYT